jgi:hypothetical protein
MSPRIAFVTALLLFYTNTKGKAAATDQIIVERNGKK